MHSQCILNNFIDAMVTNGNFDNLSKTDERHGSLNNVTQFNFRLSLRFTIENSIRNSKTRSLKIKSSSWHACRDKPNPCTLFTFISCFIKSDYTKHISKSFAFYNWTSAKPAKTPITKKREKDVLGWWTIVSDSES